jgi:F0F1-type ATP synthase assembly protein I
MPADPPSNGPRLPVGLMVAGSEMVSFTVAGLVIDYLCGTLPWFTVVLTLLGLVAAFFMLIRMSRSLGVRKSEEPKHGDGP